MRTRLRGQVLELLDELLHPDVGQEERLVPLVQQRAQLVHTLALGERLLLLGELDELLGRLRGLNWRSSVSEGMPSKMSAAPARTSACVSFCEMLMRRVSKSARLSIESTV